RALDLLHLRARAVRLPLDALRLDLAHDAFAVVDEALRDDRVVARVGSEADDRLLVSVVRAQDLRPQRPRVVGRPARRRLVEKLEIQHAAAAVPKRGADAVRAGIAAADHDDGLVLRVDVLAVLEPAVEQAL